MKANNLDCQIPEVMNKKFISMFKLRLKVRNSYMEEIKYILLVDHEFNIYMEIENFIGFYKKIVKLKYFSSKYRSILLIKMG